MGSPRRGPSLDRAQQRVVGTWAPPICDRRARRRPPSRPGRDRRERAPAQRRGVLLGRCSRARSRRGPMCLGLVADWAFEGGIERLFLLIHPENDASNQLATSMGFVREGVLRAHPWTAMAQHKRDARTGCPFVRPRADRVPYRIGRGVRQRSSPRRGRRAERATLPMSGLRRPPYAIDDLAQAIPNADVRIRPASVSAALLHMTRLVTGVRTSLDVPGERGSAQAGLGAR